MNKLKFVSGVRKPSPIYSGIFFNKINSDRSFYILKDCQYHFKY